MSSPIIGSALGRPLIAMPTVPGHRQVEWAMANVVAQKTNPFTGRQQIQNWQAGWWEATVSMPPMPRVQAEAWVSFMAACQGMSGVFYFGDGQAKTPQGTAAGMGVTTGSFQGGYQLSTSGWTPAQFALLSPGDWLQIGYRLYKCLDQPQSDSFGNASFAIWPPIREIPPSGSAIVTTNAKGLFCMKGNAQKYSTSYVRTYGLSFEIREAL